MKLFKILGTVFATLTVLYAIAFFTGNVNLWFYEYFGTRRQNVETQIFKETEMYKESMMQDLARIKYEYDTSTDPNQKKALESMIRLRYADFDLNKVPEQFKDVKTFIKQTRGY